MEHKRVYVAGHRGMAGSAICRQLAKQGDVQLVTVEHARLDLRRQAAVDAFFADHTIDEVYLAAARVGGIYANNKHPAEFLYDNLMIQSNIISAAHQAGIQKLLFLGSSCIYPRLAEQPMPEEALLTGPLEPTNEPYAIAKIAGIKLCESHNREFGRDYRSVMPTNLYGPGDNYHPEHSHVVPGLLRRFHDAAQNGADKVVIWGSGTPRREFLYVDDMAAACVHVMNLPQEMYQQITQPMLSHINVGTGVDCSISELATLLAGITGFSGRLVFDRSKPDGAPRKLLDVSRLRSSGWESSTSLEDGLRKAYQWLLDNRGAARL